jgi:hypothetical protein
MNGLSRRRFLRDGTLWGAGVWLATGLSRPETARAAATSTTPEVLSDGEWSTVEAITARILPTDHEPGAREANCVNFIDKALAREDAVARPLYQLGVAGTDAVAAKRFGKAFAALEAAEQDAVLAALESGDAPGWPTDAPVPAAEFFETIRVHTIIAFLADPKYGGNRDYTGWRVSGYPGPRHRRGGYTPAQVEGREPIDPIWKPKAS